MVTILQIRLRGFIFPLWILLIPLFFSLLSEAKAQDEESNVNSSVEYTFGEELRFLLNAENAAGIERIRLSFRPELMTERYVVDVPFEPGETISVTYPVDVGLIDLKPYSQLQYSWEIETSNGVKSLEEQTFRYDDDQFAWQQMSREAATVHWTGNGPAFGQDVLIVVEEALSNLSVLLPLESIIPFNVYVYPSSAELRVALEGVGLDGSETTHPELGAIFVTAVNPESAVADLGQSVPFELAQLLIYQIAGENYNIFPWWLGVGIGTIFQARTNPTYDQILDEAVQTETTIPLRQLCEAPEVTGNTETLARAQSASVVEYVKLRFGDQRLADLVQNYAQGNDCQVGASRALGVTLDQLEAAWLDAYGPPSSLQLFFRSTGLWLLVLLAGFAFAGLLVYVSTRVRNQS